MKIVWDEIKRQTNIRKHRLDFAALDEWFFHNAVVRTARHGRLKAIGRLDNGVIAAIFVTLGTEGLSVISMRPASRHERRLLYEQGI
ncbi:BrnT family toxin [Rhizobium sp.]